MGRSRLTMRLANWERNLDFVFARRPTGKCAHLISKPKCSGAARDLLSYRENKALARAGSGIRTDEVRPKKAAAGGRCEDQNFGVRKRGRGGQPLQGGTLHARSGPGGSGLASPADLGSCSGCDGLNFGRSERI